jgi:phage host-nuclease inhibitor protein Gam
MTKISHNKLKNTGILFEIIVRKLTTDTLSGSKVNIFPLMKKYFTNTELGKEYKLYETLIKNKNISEAKASLTIESILKASEKLDHKKLNQEKYNLIKELKSKFNLDELFKTKIPEYKVYASIYNMLEIHNSKNFNNPSLKIQNQTTLLEYLTQQSLDKKIKVNETIEEFKKYDKDLRILTYKILLEKFNTKYNVLNKEQKSLLKEFITINESTVSLKSLYNNKIKNIKEELTVLNSKTKDKITKIKIEEIIKMLTPLSNKDKFYNSNLVDVLQHYSLIEELKKVNLN